jgi:hypothetical protein
MSEGVVQPVHYLLDNWTVSSKPSQQVDGEIR